MGKSFLEVISGIKEGEVWESDSTAWDIKNITKIGDFISIKKRNESKDLCIRPDCKFNLKRQTYIFNEVFKEYEKGDIEIESTITNGRFKRIEGKDMYFSSNLHKWADLKKDTYFTVEEIRNRWYINK